MNKEDQIIALLTEVLRRLDNLERPLEPAITRTAFAKRIGRSSRTITRWIEQGKIRTEKGLIPASEVRNFLS